MNSLSVCMTEFSAFFWGFFSYFIYSSTGEMIISMQASFKTVFIIPELFPVGKTAVNIAEISTAPITLNKYPFKTMPPMRKRITLSIENIKKPLIKALPCNSVNYPPFPLKNQRFYSRLAVV